MNPKQVAVTQQTSTRPPSTNEQQFFDRSGVPAYAADDGSQSAEDDAVVFSNNKYNPYLDVNESARIMMRQMDDEGVYPRFGSNAPMTQEQASQFGADGYTDDIHGKRTMIARVMSGDPSAMQPTDAQKLAAERLFAEALLSE